MSSVNRLMLNGIMEGLKLYGATVDKMTEDVICLSIPKKPKSDKDTTPEMIVNKTQEIFDGMTKGKRTITVKYKTVD